VTASHSTRIQGGVEGTLYYQPRHPNFPPLPGDNDFGFGCPQNQACFVGIEFLDPFYLGGGFGCPVGAFCRISDSAFAVRGQAAVASVGFIARPAPGAVDWNGVTTFRIVGVAAGPPRVGEEVEKVGRTTGRTGGVITDICQDVQIAGKTLLCQTFATYGSAGGDSGSPVFQIVDLPAPNDVTLYGIHWGSFAVSGKRVFSPIEFVKFELGPLTVCAPGFVC
jgi:hypothetical protein